MTIKVDQVVDAKGLACPMPIVKTKKAVDALAAGQVLEVQATDKGSLADIKAWSKSMGHEYLGTKEEAEVLKHYIRKSASDKEKIAVSYPHIISREELKAKLSAGSVTLLDVREPAEYAFHRIPGAISLPLGEIEASLHKFDKEAAICVICHTHNRSDMASQILAENGFKNVKKVVPGMSEWDGPTEQDA